MTIAPSRNGSPKKTSAIRESIESIQPPRKPAKMPNTAPETTVPTVDSSATTIDARVP